MSVFGAHVRTIAAELWRTPGFHGFRLLLFSKHVVSVFRALGRCVRRPLRPGLVLGLRRHGCCVLSVWRRSRRRPCDTVGSLHAYPARVRLGPVCRPDHGGCWSFHGDRRRFSVVLPPRSARHWRAVNGRCLPWHWRSEPFRSVCSEWRSVNGCRARQRSPSPNLIYLPLAFAGGLWTRPGDLPQAVAADFSPVLPSRLFGELTWAAIDGRAVPFLVVGGLAAYAAVFALLLALGYRRNENGPVPMSIHELPAVDATASQMERLVYSIFGYSYSDAWLYDGADVLARAHRTKIDPVFVGDDTGRLLGYFDLRDSYGSASVTALGTLMIDPDVSEVTSVIVLNAIMKGLLARIGKAVRDDGLRLIVTTGQYGPYVDTASVRTVRVENHRSDVCQRASAQTLLQSWLPATRYGGAGHR